MKSVDDSAMLIFKVVLFGMDCSKKKTGQYCILSLYERDCLPFSFHLVLRDFKQFLHTWNVTYMYTGMNNRALK